MSSEIASSRQLWRLPRRRGRSCAARWSGSCASASTFQSPSRWRMPSRPFRRASKALRRSRKWNWMQDAQKLRIREKGQRRKLQRRVWRGSAQRRGDTSARCRGVVEMACGEKGKIFWELRKQNRKTGRPMGGRWWRWTVSCTGNSNCFTFPDPPDQDPLRDECATGCQRVVEGQWRGGPACDGRRCAHLQKNACIPRRGVIRCGRTLEEVCPRWALLHPTANNTNSTEYT